ncbi:hypothetical protein CGK40_24830, partial [Vibrio parahaemolyticus]
LLSSGARLGGFAAGSSAKLFLAAVSASTHNPDIKAQKRRLLAAGKTKMQALGDAMRKLIQICFGVLKTQTKYQPQTI